MSPNASMMLSVDALSDRIALNVMLSPERLAHALALNGARDRLEIGADEKDLAAFGEVSRKDVHRFLKNVEGVLPGTHWAFSMPELAELQAIAGDRIACRLLKDVRGTVYAAPDVACAFELQTPPQTAMTVTQNVINRLMKQHLPSAQQALMLPIQEPYRNSVITKMTMLYQEIFCYAAVPMRGASEGMLAATSNTMKQEIDRLSNLQHAPSSLKVGEGQAFRLLFQPDRVSEFSKQLFQTNTFQLLVPKNRNPQFYEAIPTLLLWLNALPPLMIEGKADGRAMTLSGNFGSQN